MHYDSTSSMTDNMAKLAEVSQATAPLDESLLSLNEQIESLNRLFSSLAQRLVPVRQPRDNDLPAGLSTDRTEKDPRQSSAVVSSVNSAARRVSDISDDVRTVLDDLEV